ncbi:uncharacterized protein EV420DRAFT_1180139 [Desarmillaria tabescens]|uniref:Uncharacterized protein n=1 Tax=Armillaria tabescens TaxID=1929756 RepID=A0AA39NB17_ARMTA|nr:uncharacterized protein EV420DRAFT_1180139 [Desarmillaria tabescens]KAK0462259.1 hypothetical protein EV420DRAFT_1180139 [Desarmillaria tabescens]
MLQSIIRVAVAVRAVGINRLRTRYLPYPQFSFLYRLPPCRHTRYKRVAHFSFSPVLKSQQASSKTGDVLWPGPSNPSAECEENQCIIHLNIVRAHSGHEIDHFCPVHKIQGVIDDVITLCMQHFELTKAPNMSRPTRRPIEHDALPQIYGHRRPCYTVWLKALTASVRIPYTEAVFPYNTVTARSPNPRKKRLQGHIMRQNFRK